MKKLNLKNDIYAELLKDTIDKSKYLAESFPEDSIYKKMRLIDLQKDIFLVPNPQCLIDNLAPHRKISWNNSFWEGTWFDECFEGTVSELLRKQMINDHVYRADDYDGDGLMIIATMYYFIDSIDPCKEGIVHMTPVSYVDESRYTGKSIIIKNKIKMIRLV